MRLRDRARRATVPQVISIDRLQRGDGLLEGPKADQPFARRKDVLKTRALHQHRLAGRQIARAAVARPTRAELDVAIVADAELAAGSGDVLAVVAERANAFGIGDDPAVLRERAKVPVVAGADVERYLERSLRMLRELDEALPLVRLLT